MPILHAVSAIVSALLFLYLFAAMIRPEKFE